MIISYVKCQKLMLTKEHFDWTGWSKVLWRDESKYSMFSSAGIKYVEHPKNKREGTPYQPQNTEVVVSWCRKCFSCDCVGP